MNDMKVVPQKQQTGPLAPSVFGEAAHHAKHKARINEGRKVLQNGYVECFPHEQQHQGHADEVSNPDADICGVAGDHFSNFLDEEAGCPQEWTDKQAAQECLVDDEKPPPQISVFLPVLLFVIVRFRILLWVGEIIVAMVLRMRSTIELERKPDTDRRPNQRATQPFR
jgi:hypothetical protein